MSIRTEDLQEKRTVTVGDDARIAVTASDLIRLVYDAVGQVNWPPDHRSLEGDPTPDPILRTVLTFCYATGIHSSGEIEAAAEHDPVIRYLCANHPPQWETIREFRRRNVPSLKFALSRVFKGAWQNRSHPYSAYSVNRLFPERDYLAAAGQGLGRAVQADSYALDV